MTGVSNEEYVKENMETHQYMSDLFYVMHTLFPKNKVSEWKNSPFLKVGWKSCLQFNDKEKSINTPYTVYWRGEDASIIGKNYVTSPGGSVSIMRAPFPCEVKKLTWANGQLPEFFWQVYNNDEAIDFSACHTVLSSDAVNDEVIRDEISVYENKIRLKYSLLTNSSILVDKYEKYVENLLKSLTEAGTTTPIFQKGELESLQGEWRVIAREILSTFKNKTFSTFSRRAKNLKYEDIKDKISIFPSYTIKLIEAYPGNEVVDKFDDDVTNENSTINKWNEWVRITSTKREALNAAKAKLGAKWSD